MSRSNTDSARISGATILTAFTALIVLHEPFVIGAAHAQCATPPTAIVEQGAATNNTGTSAAVAMDACGRFTLGWQSGGFTSNEIDVLVRQYSTAGVAATAPELVSADEHNAMNARVFHERPSVAMSASGLATVAWVGSTDDYHYVPNCFLKQAFSFGATPGQSFIPLQPPYDTLPGHSDPSAGITNGTPQGLATWVYTFLPSGAAQTTLIQRGQDCQSAAATTDICDPASVTCWYPNWKPCLAVRPSDAAHAIAWAQEEQPTDQPRFNVALRIYSAAGTLLAERVGPNDNQWVNQPANEPLFSEQTSPAVSFDNQNNLVLAWVGPSLNGCSYAFKVFARRFIFNASAPFAQRIRDPIPANGEGRAGMFIVNTDAVGESVTALDAHPGVALKLYTGQTTPGQELGSFVAAWNQHTSAGVEVRGQYFTPIGVPRAGPIRLNQAAGTNAKAWLAESSQHALQYGPDHQTLISWSQGDFYSQSGVFATLLPPSFSESLGCCKGDMDGQNGPTGADITPFKNMVLSPPSPSACQSFASYYASICPADMNNDGRVDLYDLDCFWQTVLYHTGECINNPCQLPAAAPFYDCNGNGLEDAVEIANNPSLDCNHNGMPDSCEFSLPFAGASDCNNNGIPDSCDVASGTSPDCNHNGIPDSCDVAAHTSRDRNHNGIPDECEYSLEDGPTQGGGEEGGSEESQCAPFPEDPDAAWAEYYVWAIQQTWGPASGLTGDEQYQKRTDKLCELGLIGLDE